MTEKLTIEEALVKTAVAMKEYHDNTEEGDETEDTTVFEHNESDTAHADIRRAVSAAQADIEKLKENGGGSTEGAVLYTKQTLTDEQKVQALDNIGAASVAYVDEMLGEKQFDVTGDFVTAKPKSGYPMEVITKISRDENWTIANTLELHQVNSNNLIDLAGYLGGVGTVFEMNGLTATVNADGTMTVKGTNTYSGYTELVSSWHWKTDYGKRVYPPGTYILAGGIGVQIKKAMYSSTGAADNIEGLTQPQYGLFTTTEPFRIVRLYMAIKANETVDKTFPLGVFRGAAIPDDGYVYSGNVHKVTFENPVYEGEYNWTTGELKGADGNTIAFYEPNPILGLDGTNALWTGFGEVTARGRQNGDGQNEGAVEKFDPTV